jgi:hypothetical protein
LRRADADVAIDTAHDQVKRPVAWFKNLSPAASRA